MKRASWLVAVALALALPYCGGGADSPTVVPSPVAGGSPSPSPAPTPTPEPSPSAQPSPDPTPTPTPDPTPHPSTPPPPTPDPLPDVVVNINGQAFTPASISVKVGQKVIWRNNDTVSHTATANNGAWNTGLISPGGQASITMNSAGSFPYFCQVHPNMTGNVTVTP